ncbi:FAD synthase [Candidatus Woesearchaeota archaeon]|nr:FAD synthase [Candidatus Woesearchaeota archaeon]
MVLRVLVFGTFDLLHKGHTYFLEEAKRLGDELVVVVARDKTVQEIKHKKPEDDEEKRKENLELQSVVDKVVLGSTSDDKYEVIEEVKPNVIVLGYDQKNYTEKLSEELLKRGLSAKIIRLSKSYKPEKYKTSKIREQL